MRVFQTIATSLISLGVFIHADAQILKSVTDAGNSVNATNNVLASTSSAVNNAKSTLGSILGGGKSKETNTFIISGIEYGNEDLELLKSDIKKIKGVKDIVTNFKDGTTAITIKSKDNATELLDKIPQSEKSKFKLVQSDERSVILEYKTENTESGAGSKEKVTSENVSPAINKSDVQPSPDKNTSTKDKNLKSASVNNSKGTYYVAYDFNGNTVHLESETLEKDVCSAVLGGVGKTLTVTFYNAETKTGIGFTIVDILNKIKAKKYEFDSEKTNKEKSTWENGTNTKQLNVVFQPGDDRRYQIQCTTDPTFQYQGSGYLNITKLNPVKGGIVEGEFHFSFPVYKIKDGPAEIQQVNSGKFRVAVM